MDERDDHVSVLMTSFEIQSPIIPLYVEAWSEYELVGESQMCWNLVLYVCDLQIFKIPNELFCLVNIQTKENKLMLMADGGS